MHWLSVCTRAVESEFKSNPIFPILSYFLSDFYPIFIRFLPIFRLFSTFRLADSTALVCTVLCDPFGRRPGSLM